jgi:hypothetical protein
VESTDVSEEYIVSICRMEEYAACRVVVAGVLIGILFGPENEGYASFRNVGGRLTKFSALQPRTSYA